MQLDFPCEGVFQCSLLVTSDRFLARLHCLQKRGILIAEEFSWRYMQFTCENKQLYLLVCGNQLMQNIRHNKARKLQVTSSAGCRLTYLQFEVARGVRADCLQLQVFLPAIACFLAYKLHAFLPAKAGNFACQSRANLHELCM